MDGWLEAGANGLSFQAVQPGRIVCRPQCTLCVACRRRKVMVATALVIRATGRAHPTDIAGSGVNTRVGSLAAIGSRPARKPLVMRDVPTGRSGAPAERTFSFGPFCLHPTQRLLFDAEE